MKAELMGWRVRLSAEYLCFSRHAWRRQPRSFSRESWYCPWRFPSLTGKTRFRRRDSRKAVIAWDHKSRHMVICSLYLLMCPSPVCQESKQVSGPSQLRAFCLLKKVLSCQHLRSIAVYTNTAIGQGLEVKTPGKERLYRFMTKYCRKKVKNGLTIRR